MNTEDLLKEAMHLRKPISFEYTKLGKVQGVRVGNPHAVFLSTAGQENADVYRPDPNGITTTPEKPLPDWRVYSLEFMKNVVVLHNEESFQIAPGYDPTPVSGKYKNLIAKVA